MGAANYNACIGSRTIVVVVCAAVVFCQSLPVSVNVDCGVHVIVWLEELRLRPAPLRKGECHKANACPVVLSM